MRKETRIRGERSEVSHEGWPSTHVSLIDAIKDPQDGQAWLEFVQRYRGPIVEYCKTRFGIQDAIAEDVAQEILIKLVGALQRFQYDANGSFRAYLKTVTRHAVIDLLSKENRRPEVSGGSKLEQIAKSIPETTDGFVDAISSQLRRDLLHQAEQLVRPRIKNPKNWEAYTRRNQGEPARQIGDDLGMAVAAVHKARSRVLEMIREEIARLLSTTRTQSA